MSKITVAIHVVHVELFQKNSKVWEITKKGELKYAFCVQNFILLYDETDSIFPNVLFLRCYGIVYQGCKSNNDYPERTWRKREAQYIVKIVNCMILHGKPSF